MILKRSTAKFWCDLKLSMSRDVSSLAICGDVFLVQPESVTYENRRHQVTSPQIAELLVCFLSDSWSAMQIVICCHQLTRKDKSAMATPSRKYPFSPEQGSQTGLSSINTRLSDCPRMMSAVVLAPGCCLRGLPLWSLKNVNFSFSIQVFCVVCRMQWGYQWHLLSQQDLMSCCVSHSPSALFLWAESNNGNKVRCDALCSEQ